MLRRMPDDADEGVGRGHRGPSSVKLDARLRGRQRDLRPSAAARPGTSSPTDLRNRRRSGGPDTTRSRTSHPLLGICRRSRW